MKLTEETVESINTILKIIIAIEIIILIPLTLWKLPLLQVAQFENSITNPLALAELENKFRATLAQIFGGFAIIIGLYLTWKRISINEKRADTAEKNLDVNLKGQITERFTRAIDQLGSEKLEVKTGGIYSLERIANESDEDYWPILEILISYIRKNSHVSLSYQDLPIDIQAVINVLRRRRKSYSSGESDSLDLQFTCLKEANFKKADLEMVNFMGANLTWADFAGANLTDAYLVEANLTNAYFSRADLTGAYLTGAKGLSVYQLSQVSTLYNAKLDAELMEKLSEAYPLLFEKP